MSSYSCCTNTDKTINIEDLASKLKVIGEPNRLQILCILKSRDEHCVCEFSEHMKDVSQSLLSHHLADLRAAGLVESEKRGLKVYYKLTEQGLETISTVLSLKCDCECGCKNED